MVEDGQKAVEAWGLGDSDAIDECGDEVVGVLEGIADEMESLYQFAGTLVGIVRDAVEFTMNGVALRGVAN